MPRIPLSGNLYVYKGKKFMKRLIAANWKMTGNRQKWQALAEGVHAGAKGCLNADFVLCPPFAGLGLVHAEGNVALGGQDVSPAEEGAYTGDVNAAMLTDFSCAYVIIGHSERRQYHAETNADVNAKLLQAQKHGLTPIMCIGESLEERDTNQTNVVLEKQLREGLAHVSIESAEDLVVAYEPVWAISAAGSGRKVTIDEVSSALEHIRSVVNTLLNQPVRLLYGGSVNPESAKELSSIDEMGGVLVGSASLDADKFIALAKVLTE